MISFILWYVLISIVGWLAVPIAYKLLPNLPDRGFTLARPIGLLVWGYSFWMLASLHIIQNDSGGVLFALILLAGFSFWLISLGHGWKEFVGWLKSRNRLIVIAELVFLLAFAAWALVRAANPDIVGTEKPMELAFINSILRSPTFPPNDPWLSGYAISYYYFGYVLVAMITRLTGVVSGVAFNLAVALWFGLTAVAAYGILYSLLTIWKNNTSHKAKDDPEKGITLDKSTHGWALVGALLGPFFILIVSNIEGFLEILHAKGLFWTQAADGTWQSGFWSWLGIQELTSPPSLPLSWIPTRIGGIWWWRASRVLQDFDLAGTSKEIIDEFPFFSYLLSDLHPHVLAMPFALLGVGLALNLYLKCREPAGAQGMSIFRWFKLWWDGKNPPLSATGLTSWLHRPDFWFAALALGGLAFLNTWDFPIYVALFSATYTLVRFQQEGWSIARLGDFIGTAIFLGVVGIILYFPFYVGFSSQAGGILPSLSFYTRGVQLWVMFATLLVPIVAWLIWLWRRQGSRALFWGSLKFSLAITFSLWALSYLLGWLAISLPSLGSTIMGIQGSNGTLTSIGSSFVNWGGLFAGLQGSSDSLGLLLGSFARRLVEPGAWITLIGLIALVWGMLASFKPRCPASPLEGEPLSLKEDEKDSYPTMASLNNPDPNAFVLLLVFVGCGLVLTPEFFYLRDQFGWRMNTIFKFYFQTWIIWGLSAAFVSALLISTLKKFWGVIYKVGWVILIAMSLAYPIFGILTKTDNLKPSILTLDGNAYFENGSPDEWAGIRWLQQAPLGVVAESVGGSYSQYARVSTQSGDPTVLGWVGHESQWRGGAKEMGSRETDISTLYKTSDWNTARTILDEYNIRYVFVGDLEHSTYHVNEVKFQNNLKPVFQQGSVIIYEYDGPDS
jgi:YYY domain-containing protein